MLLPSPKVAEQTSFAVNGATIPNEPPPAYVPEVFYLCSDGRISAKRPPHELPQSHSLECSNHWQLPAEESVPRVFRALIDVDIFVVGENVSANVRVDIHLQANGPITARIHASPSIARPHIYLAASSAAPISITVPTSFRGPLTIRSSRSSSSPSLPPQATIFSEAENIRRGFIGDFTDWTRDSVGDEMDLESAIVSISVLEAEGDSPEQEREDTSTDESQNPTDPFAWLRMQVPHLQHPLHHHPLYHAHAHEHQHHHAAPFQLAQPSMYQGLPAQWARLGGRGLGLGRGYGLDREGEEQQSFDPMAWIDHAHGRGRGGRGRGYGLDRGGEEQRSFDPLAWVDRVRGPGRGRRGGRGFG